MGRIHQLKFIEKGGQLWAAIFGRTSVLTIASEKLEN
jgi:hypothetical protein